MRQTKGMSVAGYCRRRKMKFSPCVPPTFFSSGGWKRVEYPCESILFLLWRNSKKGSRANRLLVFYLKLFLCALGHTLNEMFCSCTYRNRCVCVYCVRIYSPSRASLQGEECLSADGLFAVVESNSHWSASTKNTYHFQRVGSVLEHRFFLMTSPLQVQNIEESHITEYRPQATHQQ